MLNEEKTEIYDHLISLGCCHLCSLRYLCERIDFIEEKENESDVKSPKDAEENTCKKIKQETCILCLGILQPFTLDEIARHSGIAEAAEYDCGEFTCSISMPACILVREKALRWYLESKFPKYYTEEKYEVALNKAWKQFAQNRLQRLINKKFQSNSDKCDFFINVTMDYHLNENELEVLQKMQPEIFAKRKTQHRKYNNELYSRKGVVDALERTTSGVFKLHYVPLVPPIPKVPSLCRNIEYKHNSIFLAGRYCKYSRNLCQSPWVIDGVKAMDTSITEIIFGAITTEFKCLSEKNLVFSASGREDLDVRCLGDGRPFYVEIVDPKKTQISYDDFRRIESRMNERAQLIKVTDLQLVNRCELRKIKEGEETKTKVYHALCVTEYVIDDEKLALLNRVETLELSQKTPIRVLHRRPLSVRKKCVYNMKATRVEGKDRLIHLILETQAGTYVKEFVHGDFGRTSPSVVDILQMDVDIVALDVTAIKLDWPPKIDYSISNNN